MTDKVGLFIIPAENGYFVIDTQAFIEDDYSKAHVFEDLSDAYVYIRQFFTNPQAVEDIPTAGKLIEGEPLGLADLSDSEAKQIIATIHTQGNNDEQD